MNNLSTFNELITKAISYHIERINQNMEEAVRQGKLSITYTIPSVLIEEPRPNRGNGYKDWFIENYKKPALTMEVSPYVGERKVPIKYYQRIFQQNKNVPIIFAREVLTIK